MTGGRWDAMRAVAPATGLLAGRCAMKERRVHTSFTSYSVAINTPGPEHVYGRWVPYDVPHRRAFSYLLLYSPFYFVSLARRLRR